MGVIETGAAAAVANFFMLSYTYRALSGCCWLEVATNEITTTPQNISVREKQEMHLLL